MMLKRTWLFEFVLLLSLTMIVFVGQTRDKAISAIPGLSRSVHTPQIERQIQNPEERLWREYPLGMAVLSGDEEKVEQLIGQDLDVNAYQNVPYPHLDCGCGEPEFHGVTPVMVPLGAPHARWYNPIGKWERDR